MSLIQCDECGKEVSSKAEACPNCGNPIASLQNTRAQTIEATGRTWKGTQLFGITLLFIGIGTRMLAWTTDAESTQTWIWLILSGLSLWVFGRLLGWWYHG